MADITQNLKQFKSELPKEVTLVAVSKTKPNEDLQEAYNAGQRIFGENKIQEMTDKWEALPKDIQWHMIGHVQTNKVKYMAPYVNLIHSADRLKLFKEINKEAKKNERVIDVLLQVKIAEEDSKLLATAEKLTGHAGISVAFGTEGPFLQELGMDTIILGPGNIDQAHQPDEYMSLDMIKPCIDFLQEIISQQCLQ